MNGLREQQTEERAAIDAEVKDLETREAALAKALAAHRGDVDARNADFDAREKALAAAKRAILEKV